MRRFLLPLTLAAALVPASAFGQAVGVFIAKDCDAGQLLDLATNASLGAELYAVKLTSATDNGRDILWDITAKAGETGLTQSPGCSLDINVGDNWKNPTAAGHVAFVYVTYPEGAMTGGPARGNWLAVASDEPVATGGSFGSTLVHRIGDSAKSVYTGGTGLANALNLSFADAGTPISVNTGAGARSYPYGTNTGVEFVFAPVPDVQGHDVLGFGCYVGGLESPAGWHSVRTGGTPTEAQLKGYIIGYNVYAVAGVAGTVPTRTQLFNNGAGFVGHVNYNAFTLGTADTPGAPTGGVTQDTNGDTVPDIAAGDGTVAPTHAGAIGSAAGVEQVTDSARHTGDEVLIFQHTAAAPAAPNTGYWYAVQPVIGGNLADFGAAFAGFDTRSSLPGNHIVTIGGQPIGLDLNNAGTAEFISPQAALATPLPGLGLTNGGLPMMSAPIYGAPNPAAAMGEVNLTGSRAGEDVNLTFSTAVEGQNVAGFNVYRVAGSTRVRVNDALILARGGEGNVYSVVDAAVAARTASRRATAGTSQYLVEVVYSDGTDSRFVGPFMVGSDRETTRRR